MPRPTSKELARHRQFLAREAAAEKKYSRQFYDWIQLCNRTAARLYLSGGDWEGVISGITPDSIFERLYMDLTITEARLEYSELVGGEKDLIDDIVGMTSGDSNRITLWRGLLRQFLNIRIANRITMVAETTKQRIRKIIEEGLNNGEGSEETARRMRNDQDFSRVRALAISRTEAVRALNQGKYLAAKSSPYVTIKKWLPQIDSRTRQSHAAMYDKEWIDLESNFEVGTKSGGVEYAQYPCDNSLSAENSINCRCGIQLRSKRGADGRLIRKNNIL